MQFHLLLERQYSKSFKLNWLRQFSFITKLNGLYCTNKTKTKLHNLVIFS